LKSEFENRTDADKKNQDLKKKDTTNLILSQIDDSRLEFLKFCESFPIGLFRIPRPLRTTIYGDNSEISDTICVHIAFAVLLGVPQNVIINPKLEPIGWLRGPHLLEKRLDKDWSVAFGSEPLISYLRRDPWLMITDSCVQLAIAFLRHKCKQGTPSDSRLAKTILEELKIALFLPEETSKSRPKNLASRYYADRPVKLISAVTLYAYVISGFLNKPYKTGDPQKKTDISKAFEFIFKQRMPTGLIYGERDKVDPEIALAFIHFETDAPYDGIKSRYYDSVGKFSVYDILEQLDQITDNTEEQREIIEELKTELIRSYPAEELEP
jgi:hypothetical protein